MKTLLAPCPSFGRTNLKSVMRVTAFVALLALFCVPLFSSSSASSSLRGLKATPNAAGVSGGFAATPAKAPSQFFKKSVAVPTSFAMLLPQSPETIATFEHPGCTVPKNSFNLGETVCAKITNAPLGNVDRAASRIAWVSPYGSLTQGADITTDPQTSSYAIPLAATQDFTDSGGAVVTVDNRGEWRIIVTNAGDASARSEATFTVHDPAKAFVDISVHQAVTIEASQVGAGSASLFDIFVTNTGPDAAQDVVLTDTLSANATFTSVIDDGFTCGTPSGGTFTCTLASLPAGTTKLLTLSYTVNSGTPTGDAITNDVNVTSTGPAPCDDGSCELQPVDNSSSATAVVPPETGSPSCTLNCPDPITVTANTTQAGQPGAFVNYPAAQPVGSCGAVSNAPASGSFFGLGTHIITSSSESGDSCTFTVTVVDTAPPSITCPADKTVSAPSGSSEATVNPGTPTTNPSTGVTVTGSRSDGLPITDPYPVGTTLITWTVTNSNNQSASCTQRIIVNTNDCAGDTEPPTITAPPDVTASTGAGSTTCGVALSPSDDELGSPDASDNCSVTVTSNIPAGNLFPVGTTVVTYTATDGAGLTATDTQTVTVIDNTLPQISAPADASYTCPSEVPAASVSQARGTDPNLPDGGPPTDNCGAPTIGVTDTVSGAGSASSPLIITRTYTATDVNNNTASAVQTITVIDSTPPAFTSVPADATYQCASDVPAASPSQATASDNCAAPTITVSDSNNGGAGTTASPLIITRTYTATDAAGNAVSASQTITVVDNTPPTLSCPANVTAYLPLNSPATSMVVNYPAASVSDNCGGSVNVTYSQASGTVFPVGPTTVTVNATDNHGNTATCQFTVTVLYNFTGFFAPISNIPTLNSVNAGRAIPIKFSLSGDKGLNVFAANNPYTVALNCATNATSVDVTETTTAGNSSLSYSGGQYHYTWKTESSWEGTCRQLVVTLNDGSVHVANFKFK